MEWTFEEKEFERTSSMTNIRLQLPENQRGTHQKHTKAIHNAYYQEMLINKHTKNHLEIKAQSQRQLHDLQTVKPESEIYFKGVEVLISKLKVFFPAN